LSRSGRQKARARRHPAAARLPHPLSATGASGPSSRIRPSGAGGAPGRAAP